MRSRFSILCVLTLLPILSEHESPGASQSASPPSPAASTAELLNRMWSRGRATGSQLVRLKTFPLGVTDISHINPMGMMASGHTTPNDHLYLVAKEPKTGLHDVLAVADGFVVSLQWRPNPSGGQPDPTVFDRAVDLKVILEHSATCWSYVDHLVAVADFIRDAAGDLLKPGQPVPVRIPVKAGQVIGKVHGGFTFDFALVDTTVTRKGFVRPEQFLKRDPWKPHTVDPFDYIDEPLRSELLALNPRKIKPFGGRIDYDLDGRLVGNWYEQGTGGYPGANRRWDYWVGHLAIAYDHIDPTHIVFSFGSFDGRPRQFWVKGNAPDPVTISEADGVVKYELIWGQRTGGNREQIRQDADIVQATVLTQVLPNQRLKLEVFRSKSANEMNGFTEAAKFYGR